VVQLNFNFGTSSPFAQRTEERDEQHTTEESNNDEISAQSDDFFRDNMDMYITKNLPGAVSTYFCDDLKSLEHFPDRKSDKIYMRQRKSDKNMKVSVTQHFEETYARIF
jgi:hypothetical protein